MSAWACIDVGLEYCQIPNVSHPSCIVYLRGHLAQCVSSCRLLPAGPQAAAARKQHRQLLASLRPEAVSLVDAFGWEDYALNSALGRADGDVYSALLSMAKTSPLNRTEAGPAWEDVLKPVMHRKPLPKL